jgi:hypothetical protein
MRLLGIPGSNRLIVLRVKATPPPLLLLTLDASLGVKGCKVAAKFQSLHCGVDGLVGRAARHCRCACKALTQQSDTELEKIVCFTATAPGSL